MSLTDTCKVDGCDRDRRTRGWCGAHYTQWRTTGIEPAFPFTDKGRFDKYTPRGAADDCWEWQSTIKRSGYGSFWLQGESVHAHRASYILHKGPIPEGLVVRHTCDNKPCVNPKHLLLGTTQDNTQDAVERDLVCRRERNGRAKLTESQVAEIRARLNRGGETQKSMAKEFGVSRSAIQWIASGKHWTGVGEVA